MPLAAQVELRSVLLALTLTALVSLGSCAAPAARPPARISHIVFIKLEDANRTDELIADSQAKLGAIPHITSLHIGRHVDVGRGAIDADFDACLTVGFDSLEDYRAYLEHPLHVQLVDDWRERWRWIRIHDVLDEAR